MPFLILYETPAPSGPGEISPDANHASRKAIAGLVMIVASALLAGYLFLLRSLPTTAGTIERHPP